MTAPAAAIVNDDQYQVLRAYAGGRDIAAIAAEFGLRHDAVSHIVLTMASCRRPTARVLVDAYERAARQPATPVRRAVPATFLPAALTRPVPTAPEVADAPADVPEVVEPAPLVEPTPAGQPAVPAVDLAVAPDWDGSLVDEQPPREPWRGHRCPDCGRTYRHPYADHGAPAACPGRLEPVTVGGA